MSTKRARSSFPDITVLFFAGNGLAHSRIGITATKKLGKANVRNRLKRWTREIYRRSRESLGIDAQSLDIVINVKPNAAETSFEEYGRDLRRVLERVVRVVREASRHDRSAGPLCCFSAVYKRFISPLLPPMCRFEPSCSVYTMEAVEKYGVSSRRLARHETPRTLPPVQSWRLGPRPLRWKNESSSRF